MSAGFKAVPDSVETALLHERYASRVYVLTYPHAYIYYVDYLSLYRCVCMTYRECPPSGMACRASCASLLRRPSPDAKA
jgi:hypothetical protein